MKRRGLAALGLATCAAALIAAPSASAASANLCKLTATATFTKALPMNAGPFEYALSGRLDDCRSNEGFPAGAVIEAGKIYTAPNGKQYREPALSGSGNCLPGGLSQWKGGTLVVRWDGGGITLLPMGGNGQGPLLQFQGDPTLASLTLQPVDPDDDPLILTTTLFATYSSIGAAAVQYDAPADCAGAGGVKSATISGQFGPYHF